MADHHRRPYVGAGSEGARRSAQIDREEADTLHPSDERYDRLLASARQWEAQASEIAASEHTVRNHVSRDQAHAIYVTCSCGWRGPTRDTRDPKYPARLAIDAHNHRSTQ